MQLRAGGEFPEHHFACQSLTDYFADTSEAREAVRLLKDEFVRQGRAFTITVATICDGDNEVSYAASMLIDSVSGGLLPKDFYTPSAIEHHAIALAISAAAIQKKG